MIRACRQFLLQRPDDARCLRFMKAEILSQAVGFDLEMAGVDRSSAWSQEDPGYRVRPKTPAGNLTVRQIAASRRNDKDRACRADSKLSFPPEVQTALHHDRQLDMPVLMHFRAPACFQQG